MFMNEEISKEMILNGLKNNIVTIATNDGFICAEIGCNFFFFTEDDEISIEEFLNKYSEEEIAEQIYKVINDEPINGQDEDDAGEWLYYKACLS